MSKAEIYIIDSTKNCSNEKRITIGKLSHWEKQPWLTPDEARKAVEIERNEIIEKVCKFLNNDLCCYIKAQDFAIEHQRLENDLKQAIKDET